MEPSDMNLGHTIVNDVYHIIRNNQRNIESLKANVANFIKERDEDESSQSVKESPPQNPPQNPW